MTNDTKFFRAMVCWAIGGGFFLGQIVLALDLYGDRGVATPVIQQDNLHQVPAPETVNTYEQYKYSQFEIDEVNECRDPDFEVRKRQQECLRKCEIKSKSVSAPSRQTPQFSREDAENLRRRLESLDCKIRCDWPQQSIKVDYMPVGPR